jgi:hypothetical protein
MTLARAATDGGNAGPTVAAAGVAPGAEAGAAGAGAGAPGAGAADARAATAAANGCVVVCPAALRIVTLFVVLLTITVLWTLV